MDKKKVLIGMSGGVDSSVAAAILKEQGYHVAGVNMQLINCKEKEENSAVEDAKKVCKKLGIDFYVFDFKELFKQKVVDYFVSEYIAGRTPNPCVACNKFLKFGAMLDKAKEMGFDYIATGHYAKIKKEESGEYTLSVAESSEKDQSYFLYQLTQQQLAHTLMPLGDYSKDWVRKKAEELGLDVAKKPDSMEICFVENDDYAEFIKTYAKITPQKGDILDIQGNVIGEHNGLIYYTIGQRKGIGAYGRPMFVMKINAEENSIVLGEKGMEFSQWLVAENVNFISGKFLEEPIYAKVKIRYGAKGAFSKIEPFENGVKVTFEEPQRAVTPGQSVVFYDGDKVLGGGIVK